MNAAFCISNHIYIKEVIPKMPPPAFDTYHIDRWVSYGNVQSSAAVLIR